MLLELKHVSQSYAARRVLRDLSFALNTGDIGCLLGPSGCGKTTVLRAIAGFEPITGGEIVLNGERVSAPGFIIPAEKRRIGMVFQDYALFPHLNVAANVSFGLHGQSRTECNKRVEELLQTVGLEGSGQAYPHELSGGQQQRVALARALAPCPNLLLMDEPFSNLDVELRERLSLEVRDILKQQGATAIIVTHDQHEAFAMGDMIGVMHDGEIQQWDKAYNLYHLPKNRFVADFVGKGVFLPGKLLNANQVEIELGTLYSKTPDAYSTADCNDDSNKKGCEVEVLLRPDDIIHDDTSSLLAQVEHKAFRGADILYTLRLPGGNRVLSLVPSHHNHAIGEWIGIRLEVDHVVVFPKIKNAAS
ncbi:MAG: iron(III) transport system ATP-binding protein [Candidatus Nitrotoga sp. MKT]|nr:MAG: iron(III) transport system ATP-binding protein [Candidatus Nitrotoga sp. MKT]